MQELLTMTEAAALEAGELSPDLFQQFISWIDRSAITTKTYLTNLRQFAKYLRAQGISRPTREDILSYRDKLIAEGCKPATVTAYIRSVKQFFAWASAEGYYPNIAINIHTPKLDRKIHYKNALTASEALQVEKTIEATAAAKTAEAAQASRDASGRMARSSEQGARIYAMYLLAVTCGLRTIEISRANIKDLEIKAGSAALYVWGKGRSSADERKPLPAEVAGAIRNYLQLRKDNPSGSSPLFVATGNRSGGKRLAATTISTMLKGALLDAGFNSERLTAHSLRHTAGTAAQEVGKDLHKTQVFLRHASPVTTETYLHNKTDREQQALAQGVYNYLHGQEGSLEGKILEVFRELTEKQQEELFAIASRMALKTRYELRGL